MSGFCPHTSTQFWDTAGCPTIWLNSDIAYLPMASDPTGQVLSPETVPHPALLQMPHISPGLDFWPLCFWPTDYSSEAQMALSLGLISLLEWLTEPRRSVYSSDHQLVIGGHNSGTGRWERCRGQRGDKRCGASMLGEGPFPRCLQTRQLSRPCVLMSVHGGFINALLIKSLAIDDRFNLQPLSPLQGSGYGT